MKLTKNRTMKAIRYHAYGGAEVLHYEDAPQPEPERGEVLVRVKAAGVNPIDWKRREGYLRDVAPVIFPVTVGADLAGVVEAVGPDVSDLRPGDEVYGSIGTGAYAQYVVAPAESFARKPRRLNFVDAAAIPLPVTAAWQGIFDLGGLGRGQTILIHGAAGGVGSFSVQLAKWRGARVLGTGTAAQLAYMRELGVDVPIDFQASRFEDLAHNVDVVFDLVGGETHERSWTVLKPGGILVSSVQPPSPDRARQHEAHGEMLVASPSGALLAEIAALVDEGVIRPTVSQTLPLEQAARAHTLSKEKHVTGKIVLTVD